MDELKLFLAASGVQFTTYGDFISSRQDLPNHRQWLVSGTCNVLYVYTLDCGEYRCGFWGIDFRQIADKVLEIENR